MRRFLHLIGLLTLTVPLWAGEFAVLRTGYRLHADRHEVEGDRVRLFSEGGMTEIPASAVERYEAEEAVTMPPQPAPEPPKQISAQHPIQATPQELAATAARKFALPETFVASVMKTESAFQPNALSPKGAVGLMQLMPETARILGVDPRDPRQNAEGGAQYLRDLLAKYEKDPDQVLLALAAYNAGPAAVERYHGVPPFRETREYIIRVLANWRQAGGGNN
jgi:soluble lytic murein transglycosylase-like protein